MLFSLSGTDFHNHKTQYKVQFYHKGTHFQKAQGAICTGKFPKRSWGTKLKSALLRVRQHSLEFRKLSDSFPESNVKTDLILSEVKKCKNGPHYSSEFSVWIEMTCFHKQFLFFLSLD